MSTSTTKTTRAKAAAATTDDATTADEILEDVPGVGELVQNEEGRYGIVVHAGSDPNLEHKDRETGQPKPETREPVVLWLGFAAPWGLPLTRVG